MEAEQLELVKLADFKVKKKERSDKGIVRINDRDKVLLSWVAEQYAIRLDQLQVLIAMTSENPKRANPHRVTDKGALQAASVLGQRFPQHFDRM